LLIVLIADCYSETSDSVRGTVVLTRSREKGDLSSMADRTLQASAIVNIAHCEIQPARVASSNLVGASKFMTDSIAKTELVIVVYVIVNRSVTLDASHLCSGLDRLVEFESLKLLVLQPQIQTFYKRVRAR
jgi:hypothetical protein